jgi:hypothetical protein
MIVHSLIMLRLSIRAANLCFLLGFIAAAPQRCCRHRLPRGFLNRHGAEGSARRFLHFFHPRPVVDHDSLRSGTDAGSCFAFDPTYLGCLDENYIILNDYSGWPHGSSEVSGAHEDKHFGFWSRSKKEPWRR